MNDPHKKKKITQEIVTELKSHFADLANKYKLDPNEGMSILTSFYSTTVIHILKSFFEIDDFDKIQLIFLANMNKTFKELGFEITHDYELLKND
jgi:hypothetical protein